MATDIIALSYKVDSKQIEKADRALDNMAGAADNAEKETRQYTQAVGMMNTQLARTSSGTVKLGRQSSKLAKTFKIQKGAVQQAGFQIQDFAVQVASGQSAIVAFGQQGSQLAGILGPGGAVLGAVIAITSALAGMFFALKDNNEEAEKLNLNFEDLAERFKEISAVQLQALIDKTGDEIIALEKMGASTVSVVSDFDKMAATFGELTPSFASNTEGWLKVDKAITRTAAGRDSASEQLQTLKATLAEYQAQLASLFSFAETVDEDVITEKFLIPDSIWAAYASYAAFRIQAERMVATTIEEETVGSNTRMASFYREYAESRVASDIWAAEQSIAAEKTKQQNIFTIQRSFDSLFRNMMNSQSEEIFELGKFGAASKATVDAYGAINATLKEGGAFAVPAAVAIGTAAFANVASIMSTSFGAQSSGGSASANLPEPTITNNNQSTQNTVNITGGVGFGIDELQQLFDDDNILINRDSAQARELRT